MNWRLIWGYIRLPFSYVIGGRTYWWWRHREWMHRSRYFERRWYD